MLVSPTNPPEMELLFWLKNMLIGHVGQNALDNFIMAIKFNFLLPQC